MAVAHDLQVKLSEEVFQYVQAKVSSGDFQSESDVISQGVALLQQKDREFEAWLSEGEISYDVSGEMIIDAEQARWEQEVLLPILDELDAHPDSVISLEAHKTSLAQSRLERRRDA